MAHINNIGASIYTTIKVNAGTKTAGVYSGITTRPATASAWRALFEDAIGGDSSVAPVPDAEAINLGHIRDLPPLGTPPSVVNVPQYGQATSSQVKAQSDAPSLEVTFNYVPSEHGFLDNLRKNSTQLAFQVRLSNSQGVTGKNSDKFDDIYFYGTIASLEITPSLNDSMQVKVALTIDGDFEGPYSETGINGGAYNYAMPALP